MNEIEQIEQTINNYATYADSREAEKQQALFTENAEITVYSPDSEPQTIQGADSLLQGFKALEQYPHTFHLIGQKSINIIDSSNATAYVYTVAHHVIDNQDGSKSLMIMYIRYQDNLIKDNDNWLFEKRILHIDFIENRPLN